MRRALLLSYAFPPMALPEAILSTKTCGSVPGWTFDVLCAPAFRPWMGRDSSLLPYVEEHFGEVERVRPSFVARRLPLGRIRWAGNRPDALRLLNLRAARQMRRRLRSHRYDAVLTWSTWHSSHLVGLRLRRSGGPPWLAHFSDPWSKNPFVERAGRVQAANERLERAVIDAADRLLYTSQETVDLVASTFGDDYRDKSLVIPHPFDPALYPPVRPRPLGPKIVARYLGRFYGVRTPEPLLAGLAELVRSSPETADRLRVELVGGVGPGMLDTAAARTLPDGMIRVVPPVEYVESLRLAAEADFLLVVDAPTTTSVFLPSKLIDYLGAGRPIVCISSPGAARSLVEEIGGRVADPDDPVAVAAALREATTEAPATDERNDARRQPYTTTAVGARLAAALDDAVAGAATGTLTEGPARAVRDGAGGPVGE